MPPFLLGESHGDARMGLARLFGLCAALLFASSVSAANIIDLGPSDYRSYGPSGSHTSGGIRSSFGQTVRMPPGSATLSVTRNPVIPYGSVANGLRSFVRVNPASIAASAAVTGLFLAVDWAWDELEQEWVKYEFDCHPDEVCFVDGEVVVQNMCGRYPYAISAFGEVKTVIATQSFHLGSTLYPSGTTVSVRVVPSDGTGTQNMINNCSSRYPSGNWPTSPQGYFPYLTGTIVHELSEPERLTNPPDFGELEAYLPSAPAGDVSTAAGDAQRRQGGPLPGYQDQTITGPSSVSGPSSTSTSTDPVTGDTVVTNTSTQTNISYGDTTITTTNTTTSTSYQNGQETSTTTTTETPGELPVTDSGGAPPAGEWPRFCDWATVVCDWINWTQEDPPPEQDLPVLVDDDFYTERDISFGSKSCPEPYQVNLAPFMDTQVSVSFQPLCDFAGLIYYMVMAASYIIAAYISIGVARA